MWLKPWMNKIKDWQNSHIKFEWNCGKDVEFTLEDKLIQFRASGIRVKLATFAPALNWSALRLLFFHGLRAHRERGQRMRAEEDT